MKTGTARDTTMFTVTIYREKTDGDYAEEQYEGVVDMKTNPTAPKVRLEFKSEDRESAVVPFDNLHVESPLK